MSGRILLVFTVVTLVVLIVATWLYSGRSATGVDADDELFAVLAGRVNDVTAITVQTSSESFDIARDGDVWRLSSKGGYPVKFELVKQTIVGLAELELIEPKTSNPAMYDRIGVAAPGASEDSSSTQVTLKGADGELASLIIGDRAAGGSGTRWYVREPGESQAQLVDGDLPSVGNPLGWLDQQILTLDRDRVREVLIEHADGERVRVARDVSSSSTFPVTDIPAGFEETRAGVGNSIGTGLNNLRFDDVARDGELDVPDEPAVFVAATTFDGLVIRVRLWQEDETSWAMFEATDVATAGGVGAEDADTPSPADEAAELNDRFAGWAFALSQFQYDNLAKRPADVIQAVGPPEDELEGPPGG